MHMNSLDSIILLALAGFFVLAFLVLWPVYRFLKKQEQVGEQFTRAFLEGQFDLKPNDEEVSPSQK